MHDGLAYGTTPFKTSVRFRYCFEPLNEQKRVKMFCKMLTITARQKTPWGLFTLESVLNDWVLKSDFLKFGFLIKVSVTEFTFMFEFNNQKILLRNRIQKQIFRLTQKHILQFHDYLPLIKPVWTWLKGVEREKRDWERERERVRECK